DLIYSAHRNSSYCSCWLPRDGGASATSLKEDPRGDAAADGATSRRSRSSRNQAGVAPLTVAAARTLGLREDAFRVRLSPLCQAYRSDHTADLGKGSNANFENSKGGWGVGSIYPRTPAQRHKRLAPTRRNCTIYDDRRDRNAGKFCTYFNGSSPELGRDGSFYVQLLTPPLNPQLAFYRR